VFGFVALLLTPSSVTGQTYQGGVRGLVKDPNGVIPGAEVTLTNEATNATRSTTTNEVGEYAFANVLPATYSLKVTMTGFKALERKGVRVGAQQSLTSDFTMEVGTLSGGNHRHW
jgi:hypothetical protein